MQQQNECAGCHFWSNVPFIEQCVIYGAIGGLPSDFYFFGEMWNFEIARPRDTRILVPEKNRAAQNRASWGLYLCTKWDFFYKNRVSSRLLFKIRASWGYTYVLKGIFIDFFLAYLAIGTFFNWDLWTIGTFKQLGIGMFGQLGPWAIGTFGQLEIVGSS